MSWTLHGLTIHPENEEFGETWEANYSIQDVLDATVSTVSYYGAKSAVVQIAFSLFENENSNTGLSTLRTDWQTGATISLVGDIGTLGNVNILSMSVRRRQALNYSQPVYKISAELIYV